MNHIAEDLVRAVATFGITASAATATYMRWSGSQITSDDSYIVGISIGVIVSSILLVTLFCERVWNRKVSLWICVAFYALLGIYATFVIFSSELHGPGIAVLLLSGSLFFGIIEFGFLRRIRSIYYNALGMSAAIAFVALFTTIYR